MDWRDYEEIVYQELLRAYPDAHILKNATLDGVYSRTKRQVDILVEDSVHDSTIRTAIDAKYYNKKVDVKCVESCISMFEDIQVNNGVIVTSSGYTKSALNRAKNCHSDMTLEILSPVELLEFQGVTTLPYFGNICILLNAPFGMIIELDKSHQLLACIIPRGENIHSAMRGGTWMYCNAWKKDSSVHNTEQLVLKQNNQISDRYGSTNFRVTHVMLRKDGRRVTLRSFTFEKNLQAEITGFIDFGDLIFFIVCHCSTLTLNTYEQKVKHLLKYATACIIEFNNTAVIRSLLEQLNSTTLGTDRALMLRQIGKWYLEEGNKNEYERYMNLAAQEDQKFH